MRKLILSNFQSPGDIVMLTAAVRDLHLRYPGQFLTDVRTVCPQLWENNPYLTSLCVGDSDVESIDCQYPLIHRSNQEPWHFLHAFNDYLSQRLEIPIPPTAFKGDIHVSPLEKSWMSQVQEITRDPLPFWVFNAGGKFDYTVKWWDPARYQAVVDHFRGRILFVQVGELPHHHPPVEGVVDLRGKTDLRQLVRLVYHAQGVLSPVSLLMHLAAAVEVRPGMPQNRPCVVVAGGREPPHWEAYPHHQFIHTVGALRCCDNGGCWKSRTVALGDGDVNDQPGNLCVDVVGALPRCMHMITADEVIRRIELYFRGGAIEYLTPAQAGIAGVALEQTGSIDVGSGHRLFKPASMQEGMETVAGACNGIPKEQRWAEETPAFAREILQLLPPDGATILDYGCGMGRIAKEILQQNGKVTVIGVDDSGEELALARTYVDTPRFITMKPQELNEPVDLAFCIYVFQHIPAVEIREALQRVHHYLRDDGYLIYCSSDYRMAVRFDAPGFEDDRRLGVDLRREISRYFVLHRELFCEDALEASPVVKTIVRGGNGGLAHPALVFRKRIHDGPLFNYRWDS
jgi:ADP-heptose:LPS heptosyltransferase/SAM-dependent methyltransferase